MPGVKLTVNLISMATSKFVGGLLSYLVLLASARLLGVEGYGNLTLSLSIVFLLLPFMDFGIDPLCVKWVSRGEIDRFYSLWNTKLLTTGAGIIIIAAASFFLPVEIRTTVIVLGVAMSFTIHLTIIHSYYRGIENMICDAFLVCGHRSLLLLLAFIFISTWKTVLAASFAYMISAFVFLIVAFILINNMRSFSIKNIFVFNKKNTAGNILEAYPLALITLLGTIYSKVSSILLASFTDISEVGVFNSAVNIIEGLLLISATIVIVSFPSLSRLGKENTPHLFKLVGKLFLILLILAIAAFSVTYSFAGPLIEFVLGPQYAASIDVLKILIFSIVAMFLTNLLTTLLIAVDLQKIYLYIVAGGAVINIILNLVFIPQYGAKGAAIAFVFTEISILVACGAAIYSFKRKRSLEFRQT